MATAATSSAFSISGSIVSRSVMKKQYSSRNTLVAFPHKKPSSYSAAISSKQPRYTRSSVICHWSLTLIPPFFKDDTPSYRKTSTLRQALSDDSLMMKVFEEWMHDFSRVYDTQEEKQRRFELFKENVKNEVHDSNKVWFRLQTYALHREADWTQEESSICYNQRLHEEDLHNIRQYISEMEENWEEFTRRYGKSVMEQEIDSLKWMLLYEEERRSEEDQKK